MSAVQGLAVGKGFLAGLQHSKNEKWQPKQNVKQIRQPRRELRQIALLSASPSSLLLSSRNQFHRKPTFHGTISRIQNKSSTLSKTFIPTTTFPRSPSRFPFNSLQSPSKTAPLPALRASRDSETNAVPNSAALYPEAPEAEASPTVEDLEQFLKISLPEHPRVQRGVLSNGLKYVILENKVPANRFEAHLEMHVGSVDELPHEQGIAHMIEHVTFLGSKKRDRIMSCGARSNAYTDFHHTVFHVHSPASSEAGKGSGNGSSAAPASLLPLVLETLHDIAFRPQFLPNRIEKERKAILSEMQMMNTIEYRVDCQLLQSLHSENLLSQRFPIGREEQIQSWDLDTIRAFHQRWYFPANATLYIVGDIPPIPETVRHIETYFGPEPPGYETPFPAPESSPVQPPASPAPPTPPAPSSLPFPLSLLNSFSPKAPPPAPVAPSPALEAPSALSQSPPVLKKRHSVRPPVLHRWSSSDRPTVNGYDPPAGFRVVPDVFQHALLQNFTMSIFCKTPVSRVTTLGDLRLILMQRIVLSSLQFRINNRYKDGSAPFLSIELDHSDSGREACTVTTLTVNAIPKHWKGAVKTAMQEARRLWQHGVTSGELQRYLLALVKDSEQLAAMADSIPSLDQLDFVMENDALQHTLTDHVQSHQCLMQIVENTEISLEEVNQVARNLMAFLADYYLTGGSKSGSNGSFRPTTVPAGVIACVPKKVHHDDGSEGEFVISGEEIEEVVIEGLSEDVDPEPEVEVPAHLVSPEHLSALRKAVKPQFVRNTVDPVTGIVQKQLSNGIRINVKSTENEMKGGMLRVVVPGGRSLEDSSSGGAVIIGVRTLSEGGTVADFSREQVELFCLKHLINCVLESDEEFICMDFHFTVRDGGLPATLQLLHLVLERPVWDQQALDRAKQLYLSHFRSIPKSLERATAVKLMRSMFSEDERILDPKPKAIHDLTLDSVRDTVMRQIKADPTQMEISIVGDVQDGDIEDLLLSYLGTISFDRPPLLQEVSSDPTINFTPLKIATGIREQQILHQKVYLKDTDERARAYIAGPAPNRWGFTQDGRDLNLSRDPVPPGMSEEQVQALTSLGATLTQEPGGEQFWLRRKHPLYTSVNLSLLSEIISSRLFSTVRDTLSLTYDVSFELSTLDRLHLGWFVVSVTSTPQKVDQAMEASLRVIRGLHSSRVTQRELDRAKRTVLMRHESDLKDNGYWIGLLTHIQSDLVPRKTVQCIQDLVTLYQVATVEDVQLAYGGLDLREGSVFTCLGVAGQNVQVPTGPDFGGWGPDGDPGELSEDSEFPAPVHGRGASMMTRPTT